MTTPVSVVLPTRNEAATVGPTIAHLREHLPEAAVVVVDDDSPDGTAAVVRDAYGDDPDVTTLIRTDASGLASAVLAGIRAAEGDILGVMDADLQHPPATMGQLVASIEAGHDLAIGSRHLETGGVASAWGVRRRALSRGADTLARVAVPHARRLSDPMSGLFAVDREVLDPVLDRLDPSGYKILLELLARAPITRIEEIPYVFGERAAGDSNLGPTEYLRYIDHLTRLAVPARRPSLVFDEAADVAACEPPTVEVSADGAD